ncbi:hypothetical protein [Nocardia concava]|uniref:hypothetical protein n=1 Tax=Nocardia concava TaxID=257281 RepID=UPI000594DA82|nr:hypothetical protein [Nocardia concava]
MPLLGAAGKTPARKKTIMSKAVEQTRSGLTVAHAGLGRAPDGTVDSVARAVHDGDTVSIDPAGNVSTRLLGMDAPEVSFTLPDAPKTFRSIGSPQWADFLNDPFAAGTPPFDPPLAAPLLADLRARLGAGCAANHAKHAGVATKVLEGLVDKDRTDKGATLEDFRFFLAFATDVIDRYGRFLCYLNVDVPKGQSHPLTYNERLLAGGFVTPYFIWPNIDPFRRQPVLTDAVPVPGQPISDPRLDAARQSVKAARAAHDGVFETADPLRLLPFELRYLGRVAERGGQTVRTGPDRWVIDLNATDGKLLAPHRYIEIPLPEDRLFVPSEFLPLFLLKGWAEA